MTKPAPEPKTRADFSAALVALKAPDHLAIAFSGGPDSLALLILAAAWAKRSRKRRVTAMTVDHGLRAQSAAEAKRAGAMAAKLGVEHVILTWQGAKPQGDIQAAAREARYRLLSEACLARSIGAILVAHHQEDQAETFLLRLARGSGVDGLSGMAPQRVLVPGVRLLRPLLNVPQEKLRAVVAGCGIEPIIDPSNENMRFARVRMRQAIPMLAELGIDAGRLAQTAARMGRARAALDAICDRWFDDHGLIYPSGAIAADAGALVSAPEDIGLRLLARILRLVAGADYAPRFEMLESAFQALYEGSIGKGRTLAGVKLSLSGGKLVAVREISLAAKVPPLVLRAGERALWDGRFDVSLVKAPARAGVATVRALGAEAARRLIAEGYEAPEGPKLAFASTPSLWRGERLLAAPLFGMSAKGWAFEAKFSASRR